MSFLFTENFQSYAIGAALTKPPWEQGGQNGAIVADGDNSNRAFQIRSNAFTRVTNKSSLTIYFAIKVPPTGDTTPLSNIFTLNNGNPSVDQSIGTNIFTLSIEQDYTLTVTTPGALIDSTGINGTNFVLEPESWHFIQLGLTIDQFGTLVRVQTDVIVNGIKVLSGLKISIINVTSLFSGDATGNIHTFFSYANAGTLLDNLSIVSPRDPDYTYPDPGTPKIKIAQGIVETAVVPDTSIVRMAQGIVEHLILPDNGRLRVAQAVIELIMGISTPAAGRGWRVREF